MDKMFYTLEEVAQHFGKSQSEVQQMLSEARIFPKRDGGVSKITAADFDKLVNPPQPSNYYDYDDDGDVDLNSQVSDTGSGTVVGGAASSGGPSSDIGLAIDNDLDNFSGSSLDTGDINATLDAGEGGSVLDLDDGDLVLDSSDVALDESSGINLYKPEGDSGLSLDDESLQSPLEDGSLDVGLDSLVLDDEGLSIIDEGSGLMDDGGDFTLTPAAEDSDDESDSGSQIIPMVDDGSGDLGDPLLAEGGGRFDNFGGGQDQAPMNNQFDQPQTYQPMPISAESDAALPEKPYSILVVLSLFLCVVLLGMTLMMTVDLIRNMWSWNKPFELNSQLMDWLLSYFQ